MSDQPTRQDTVAGRGGRRPGNRRWGLILRPTHVRAPASRAGKRRWFKNGGFFHIYQCTLRSGFRINVRTHANTQTIARIHTNTLFRSDCMDFFPGHTPLARTLHRPFTGLPNPLSLSSVLSSSESPRLLPPVVPPPAQYHPISYPAIHATTVILSWKDRFLCISMLFAASSASVSRQFALCYTSNILFRFPSGHQWYSLLSRHDKIEWLYLVKSTFISLSRLFRKSHCLLR